jgi:hypothetical protein
LKNLKESKEGSWKCTICSKVSPPRTIRQCWTCHTYMKRKTCERSQSAYDSCAHYQPCSR